MMSGGGLPPCRRSTPEDDGHSCALTAAHGGRHRSAVGYEWPERLPDKHEARGNVVAAASRLGMPQPGATLSIFDANLRLLEEPLKAQECTIEQLAILVAAANDA